MFQLAVLMRPPISHFDSKSRKCWRPVIPMKQSVGWHIDVIKCSCVLLEIRPFIRLFIWL